MPFSKVAVNFKLFYITFLTVDLGYTDNVSGYACNGGIGCSYEVLLYCKLIKTCYLLIDTMRCTTKYYRNHKISASTSLVPAIG